MSEQMKYYKLLRELIGLEKNRGTETKRTFFKKDLGRLPPFIYAFHCKNENVTYLEVFFDGLSTMKLEGSEKGFVPPFNIPSLICPYLILSFKGYDSENNEIPIIEEDQIELEYFAPVIDVRKAMRYSNIDFVSDLGIFRVSGGALGRVNYGRRAVGLH